MLVHIHPARLVASLLDSVQGPLIVIAQKVFEGSGRSKFQVFSGIFSLQELAQAPLILLATGL